MKNFLLTCLATCLLLFTHTNSHAQLPDIEFDASESCWYEVDGQYYFRIVTNRPNNPAVSDVHMYIKISGVWSGQLLRSHYYTSPIDATKDIHIFNITDPINGNLILPDPDGCYEIFIHPDATIIPPSQFGTTFNVCECDEDCDASIKYTYWGNYTVTLEPLNYPYNPTDPNIYTWSYGDGTGGIIHSWSKIYPGPGQYTVCLTIDNGNGICKECIEICLPEEKNGNDGDTTQGQKPAPKDTEVNSGLAKVQPNVFYLYPNPTNGHFTLQIDSKSENEEVYIVITDLSGRVVNQSNYDINKGIQKIEFNTSNLSQGLYHFKAYTRASGSFVSLLNISK